MRKAYRAGRALGRPPRHALQAQARPIALAELRQVQGRQRRPRTGHRRLRRGAAFVAARQESRRLGDDPEQSRRRAVGARRRASPAPRRSNEAAQAYESALDGLHQGSRSARLGDGQDQSRLGAVEARRARERHRHAGKGGRRLSRGARRADARRTHRCNGRQRRTISAARSPSSASARPGPSACRRRSRAYGEARQGIYARQACRSIGRCCRTISARC